jgi:hypothetical protein
MSSSFPPSGTSSPESEFYSTLATTNLCNEFKTKEDNLHLQGEKARTSQDFDLMKREKQQLVDWLCTSLETLYRAEMDLRNRRLYNQAANAATSFKELSVLTTRFQSSSKLRRIAAASTFFFGSHFLFSLFSLTRFLSCSDRLFVRFARSRSVGACFYLPQQEFHDDTCSYRFPAHCT